MAGGKNNRRVMRNKSQRRSSAVPRSLAPSAATFDAASAAYLRLLADPCSGDMVPPTFGGTGSGYLMRTKYVQSAGNVVDSVFEFTPQFALTPYRFTGSMATGTQLSAATFTGLPAQLQSIAGTYRCIAACLKVYYTGSELTRQGIVASSLTGGPYLTNGQTPVQFAPAFAEKATRYVRLGTEMHEVRWVPQESDQNFVSVSQPENLNDVFYEGATIQMVVLNAPANTIQYEVTAVWEWTPRTEPGTGVSTAGGSIVYSPRAPSTPLPLNATLHKIGDLARFATDPAMHAEAGRRISSTLAFGQGVYNAAKFVGGGMKMAARLGSRVAPLLLM